MSITNNPQASYFNISLRSDDLAELAKRASEAGTNINEQAANMLASVLRSPQDEDLSNDARQELIESATEGGRK